MESGFSAGRPPTGSQSKLSGGHQVLRLADQLTLPVASRNKYHDRCSLERMVSCSSLALRVVSPTGSILKLFFSRLRHLYQFH